MSMDTDIHPEIKALEKAIAARDWQKKDFYELIGISSQTYNNWRSRGVPAKRRADVAKVMGWDELAFLRGDIINQAQDLVHEQAATYLEPTDSGSAELASIYAALDKEDRGRLLVIARALFDPKATAILLKSAPAFKPPRPRTKASAAISAKGGQKG